MELMWLLLGLAFVAGTNAPLLPREERVVARAALSPDWITRRA
jgi:hypothetical protein